MSTPPEFCPQGHDMSVHVKWYKKYRDDERVSWRCGECARIRARKQYIKEKSEGRRRKSGKVVKGRVDLDIMIVLSCDHKRRFKQPWPKANDDILCVTCNEPVTVRAVEMIDYTTKFSDITINVYRRQYEEHNG